MGETKSRFLDLIIHSIGVYWFYDRINQSSWQSSNVGVFVIWKRLLTRNRCSFITEIQRIKNIFLNTLLAKQFGERKNRSRMSTLFCRCRIRRWSIKKLIWCCTFFFKRWINSSSARRDKKEERNQLTMMIITLKRRQISTFNPTDWYWMGRSINSCVADMSLCIDCCLVKRNATI